MRLQQPKNQKPPRNQTNPDNTDIIFNKIMVWLMVL